MGGEIDDVGDSVSAVVTASRPNAVTVSRSPLRAAGGGQAADRGWLTLPDGAAVSVSDVQDEADGRWHAVDRNLEVGAQVEIRLDVGHREVLSRLHTAAHLLNALVFARFDGALVNGAHISGDGTARVDFDLPAADNSVLRAFGGEVNDLVRDDRAVRQYRLPAPEVLDTPGMVRSLGRVPPVGPDGMISVVDIDGFDRQACGGTHVESTAKIGEIEIVKIDNRGRHNRRVIFRLVDERP